MSDLIDRQAAIDAIDSLYFDTVEDHDRTKERIKRLPSVQPEIRYYGQFEIKDPILISAQQWIPCSERLPELDESVLATTAWNDITIAWRIGICEWFIHEGNTNAETADVIAWMPLPESYKGEQE